MGGTLLWAGRSTTSWNSFVTCRMRSCRSMSLYDELKGWQSGIAALFGFIALIIGALWNFRLNRRRDAALRAEEAISVAAALYGEVVLLRMEVASLARSVANVAVSIGTERDPI